MKKENPFGNPDGARADINEVIETFISGSPYAIDNSTSLEALLNKRVIVGAKGSGKTIYLRKIQSLLKSRAENQNTGIYVDEDIDQNLNCTERVIAFCDLFTQNVLSEKWTQLWKIALWVTLAFKYLYDPILTQYISNEQKKSIEKILLSLNVLPKYEVPFSTYQVFTLLLNYANTANEINRRLEQEEWTTLEYTLTKILKMSPAIYLFLDSIDIEYEHAPMYWTACQKGLFYAVMDLLQKKTWGEKFHIIMSIRNNVFISVLRSEHSSKFSEESHIYILDWDYSQIKYFISEKVKKLNQCYFFESSDEKDVTSWLGIKEINDDNQTQTPILDYIARHTRFVPRDAVIICNKLSTLRLLFEMDPTIDIQSKIREIIKERSAFFGNELLTICAKNINANQTPNGAGRYRYSDGFTSYDYYQQSSYHKLKNILSQLSSPIISYDELNDLQAQVDQELNTTSYLADVLWQNCAIGYIDTSGLAKYYTQKGNIDQLLPKAKKQYILRTCITDALSINTNNTKPERPA